MSFDFLLAASLLLLLAGMQAFCWLLAKGLGRRLERPVLVLGLGLPFLLLLPHLSAEHLMVPADPLQQQIPLAPGVATSHRHDLLNDAIYCLLPWELEVRHAFAAGRLPLWSDGLEGGSSPWINPQAQPLSPVAMLTRLLPIQHHLLAALALKILVACQGTWLLARSVGASRLSSLLAGAGFALGGGILAWSLFPHSTVAAWVPWLAAAALRLFRGGDGRTVATAALLTAALLLSGQPETAAGGGLFTALVGLSLARRREFRRGFAKAALAGALGFCLAAPQLLPFALHLPQSARVHEVVDRELPPYLVRLEAPLSWFVPGFGKYMLAPVSPRAYGIPFETAFDGPFNWLEAECGYAGLLAFAGSLAALAGWRRKRIWPFLGFGIAALLLTAQPIALAEAIHAVSFLKTVAWSRFLLVGCLALAIAGALGFDLLFARRGRLRYYAFAGLLAAAALSLASHTDPYVLSLWLALLAAAALGVWAAGRAAGRRKRGREAAFAGLALVLLLDLLPWGRGFLPSSSPALFYPRTAFLDALEEETRAAGGPYRAVGHDFLLFPSLLPVYGIDELRPHNPLTSVHYLRPLAAAFGFAPSTVDYFPAFSGLDHPLLDFLGVRVVASAAGSAPPATLERIDGGRFGPYRLYRNPDALPRHFVPASAEAIGGELEDGELEDFLARLRDPRHVAVDDPRAVAWAAHGGSEVKAAVTDRAGWASLEISGDGDRLLATSLRHPEGWRTGGLDTETVNGAFLGVHVPPGVTRVELRYRPPGLAAGLLLAALAAAATAWLASSRRR